MKTVLLTLVCATVLQATQKTPEYASDLGPETIPIAAYPTDMQAGYAKFQTKCGVCHSAARAVNSEFVEAKQWSRYILRMQMRPPCCNRCSYISHDDAKSIYQFLVYDSQIRKTGPQAQTWAQHRAALLAEFKAKYPKKYEQQSGVGRSP